MRSKAGEPFQQNLERSNHYEGTVQLNGFVNSQKAVDKAVEITRSVNGVKSVKNNLIVK